MSGSYFTNGFSGLSRNASQVPLLAYGPWPARRRLLVPLQETSARRITAPSGCSRRPGRLHVQFGNLPKTLCHLKITCRVYAVWKLYTPDNGLLTNLKYKVKTKTL